MLRGERRLLSVCEMGTDALASRFAKGCAQKGKQAATTSTSVSCFGK